MPFLHPTGCCFWLLQGDEVGCGTPVIPRWLGKESLIVLLPSLFHLHITMTRWLCFPQYLWPGWGGRRQIQRGAAEPTERSRPRGFTAASSPSPAEGWEGLPAPFLTYRGFVCHGEAGEGACGKFSGGENANHMFRPGSSCRAESSREARGAGILQFGWARRGEGDPAWPAEG